MSSIEQIPPTASAPHLSSSLEKEKHLGNNPDKLQKQLAQALLHHTEHMGKIMRYGSIASTPTGYTMGYIAFKEHIANDQLFLSGISIVYAPLLISTLLNKPIWITKKARIHLQHKLHLYKDRTLAGDTIPTPQHPKHL